MPFTIRNFARVTFLAVALVAVTACGGGSATDYTAMYSIGGTVTGIGAGQSVVLQDNGGDNLTISANGAFTFATKVASGGTYAVTVLAQPSGEICGVTPGLGTASANVTDVAVFCGNAYTVGASVSGLVGQGLELKLFRPRGGAGYGAKYWSLQLLEITGNGDFAFPTPVPLTAYSYGVGIELQPHSPTQRCVVSSFSIEATNTADMAVACEAFSYVTNAGENTISVFSVDATTGAIASVGPPVSTGLSPYAIAGTSNRALLYVVNSGSNNVSAFAVDPHSGALTAVPGSPFAAGTNPRALALNFSPSVGPLLYVANSGSNDLSVYLIDNIGALTPASPLWGSRATGAGPSVIAIDPSGQFLYTANTGGSSDISAFLTDSMTPVTGSPFPSGSSVSSLAFGAGGKFLYAADASGSTAGIYGFTIKPFGFINPDPQTVIVDPSSGALTSLPGFPYKLPTCNFVVADQTGTYLYATTGTDLRGYSIDVLTGALTALSGFPIAVGADVRSVSIDPANQFLYVANGSAGTVTGFQLDAATGALSPMPSSPFAVGTSADFFATF